LGQVEQLYSNLGNFKQLHSNWVMYKNCIEIWIQSYTFGQIPTTSSRIWVIKTVLLKLGYYWKDLGKVEEVHTDLHML